MKIQNNITFGAKVPTKTVLGLASERCLYDNAWHDNIKTIEKLAGKNSMDGMASMGTVVTFEKVGRVIKKLIPDLEPFLKDIDCLRYIRISKRDDKINKIVKAAEDKFGKEIEIPEEEIRRVVKATNAPLNAILMDI